MGVTIAVDKRSDGQLQICIENSKTGTGLRLAGPKYDGTGKRLLKRDLTLRDADEIRSYLELVK